MKIYKITLRSRWGEPYVVTVTARNYLEAKSQIMFSHGWYVESYSVVGVIA